MRTPNHSNHQSGIILKNSIIICCLIMCWMCNCCIKWTCITMNEQCLQPESKLGEKLNKKLISLWNWVVFCLLTDKIISIKSLVLIRTSVWIVGSSLRSLFQSLTLVAYVICSMCTLWMNERTWRIFYFVYMFSLNFLDLYFVDFLTKCNLKYRIIVGKNSIRFELLFYDPFYQLFHHVRNK